MKTCISVAVLVLLCFFQKGDAAITLWSTPPIATGSGTGSLTFAENNATGTGGVATTINAISDSGAVLYTSDERNVILSQRYWGAVPRYCHWAVDDTGYFATATVIVTVTDVNEAPVFASALYGACIVDGSGAGTTLTTVTATDQDSGNTIAYSLSAGNTAGHFSISSATGVITVANGKTLTQRITPSYVLVAVAYDNDGTPLTGTTTKVVVVHSTDGRSAALLASFALVLMTSFIKLLI